MVLQGVLQWIVKGMVSIKELQAKGKDYEKSDNFFKPSFLPILCSSLLYR
jgi:hypothetical protein